VSDACVIAIIADLKRRWPVSMKVLARHLVAHESATELAKSFKGAPRTIREHIAHTKAAIRAYGEWQNKHGGTETPTALIAEVDALERLWVKKRK
jgi:hypothetical protein